MSRASLRPHMVPRLYQLARVQAHATVRQIEVALLATARAMGMGEVRLASWLASFAAQCGPIHGPGITILRLHVSAAAWALW